MAASLDAGHQVTIFHRGMTNPGLFPDAEEIIGDRDGGLDALAGGRWDAVVDMCGYVPRVVKQSAQLLKGQTAQYLFVSSISVYRFEGVDTIDEESPLSTIADESIEEITGETYGPLKTLCEREVQSAFGERALIIRPGLIVGPWDKSDRFTYWVARMADGGDVLVPDRLDQPVQFIDVRDLADWFVMLVKSQASGIFNATGPAEPLSLGGFLHVCNEATGGLSKLVAAPVRFLDVQGVEAWTDLPLVDPYDGSADSMSRADISKARSAGLDFRPIPNTIRDTLSWYASDRGTHLLRAGISREREANLLASLPEAILE